MMVLKDGCSHGRISVQRVERKARGRPVPLLRTPIIRDHHQRQGQSLPRLTASKYIQRSILIAEWSKAVSHNWGHGLVAEWSKALSRNARYLSTLGAWPGSRVV